MDTAKNYAKNVNKTKRFIILIPHRDALKPLGEYRQRLFAAGLYSAFSFPFSAPLAEVSRPFSREELKTLARSIRGLTGKTGGKITGNSACQAVKAGQISFFGPPLDLPVTEGTFPESAKDKLLCTLNPPVLCLALAGHCSNNAPPTSFRAAYLANLAIRPLAGAGFSFEWKIGEPAWLPKTLNSS